MRLEFLGSGSRDAPLIRLFGTDVEPLRQLLLATERLSHRIGEAVDVDKIVGIAAVNDCRLKLETVRSRPPSLVARKGGSLNFIGQATGEDWVTVHELLEPMLCSACGFQWLMGGDARGCLGESSIALLVSTYPDGQW